MIYGVVLMATYVQSFVQIKTLDFTSINKQILERGTLSQRDTGFNGGYVHVYTRKTHRSMFFGSHVIGKVLRLYFFRGT